MRQRKNNCYWVLLAVSLITISYCLERDITQWIDGSSKRGKTAALASNGLVNRVLTLESIWYQTLTVRNSSQLLSG
jgi:hypothetical protein